MEKPSCFERVYVYFQDRPNKIHMPEMRWRLIFFSFLVLVFSFYSFDLPAPNQHSLQHRDMNLSTPQYNLFYACFLLPNVVFIFFIGHFMDVYGDKFVLFMLSVGVLIGAWIFAIAISYRAYYLAVFGRLVFGMCFEPVAMIGKYFPTKWFKNYEISTAYAISMTASRLGITLVSYFSPILYNYGGIDLPMYVAAVFAIIPVIVSILIGTYDKQFVICLEEVNAKPLLGNTNEENLQVETKVANVYDVLNYGKSFWASMGVMFFTFSAFYTLCANLNELLVTIYRISVEEAGEIISIAYISFCAVSICCGGIIDRYENKMQLLRISHVAFMVSCIILMYFPKLFLFLAFFFLLIHFCLIQTAFWIIFGKLLKPHQTKKGFAVAFAIHDGTFSLFTILFGVIRDSTIHNRGGFFYSLVFLIVQGFGGLLSTYFI